MRIEAPYPDPDRIIIMPKPLLRNTLSLRDERDYRIMMNKDVHSYIRRTDSILYTYSFHLTREKAEEMLNFLRVYSTAIWRWRDHHGVYLIGRCLNNPHETVIQLGPFLQCGDDGFSINEKITFELELET